MIEKKMRVIALHDFYGELLTDKQNDIITLYFEEDLSLSEIAEALGISRQGVHDNLKRAVAHLEDYETKLGLFGKFSLQKNNLMRVLDKMESIDPSKDSDEYESIKEEIRNLIY